MAEEFALRILVPRALLVDAPLLFDWVVVDTVSNGVIRQLLT